MVWRFLKKTANRTTIPPRIPWLGIYPEKTIVQNNTCIQIFTAVVFITARMWRPNCLWKMKLYTYTYTMYILCIHIYSVYIVHTYKYTMYIYTYIEYIQCIYIYIYTMECSVVSDSLLPVHGLLCPWNLSGRNTRGDSPPGDLPDPGLNLHLLGRLH